MDKRTYTRKNISMPVVYEVRETGINKGNHPFNGSIHNIGIGGVCMTTDDMVELGRVVVLNLCVEDTDVTVPAFTEVKWAEPIGDKGKYRIGLQFLR